MAINRVSIQSICKRWAKTSDYILALGEEDELGLWVSVQNVLVEQENDDCPPSHHKRYEFRLLPQHIAELVWPNDAQIESKVLNGKGIGDDGEYYVQVYRALKADGNFIICRSDLYARLEEVKELDKIIGIGPSPLTAIEHQTEEIDTEVVK